MKIGFIGMGNMASAIVNGAMNKGFIDKKDVYGYDIDASKLSNINACANAIDVINQVDITFMAVKPYVVDSVLDEVKDALKDKALVSIVLGYDFNKYEEILDKSTRHLTIMPNTPLLVGAGMTLFESIHSLSETEFQFVFKMFSSIGEVEILTPHEFKAGGTLSGCGPAFLYMIIDSEEEIPLFIGILDHLE